MGGGAKTLTHRLREAELIDRGLDSGGWQPNCCHLPTEVVTALAGLVSVGHPVGLGRVESHVLATLVQKGHAATSIRTQDAGALRTHSVAVRDGCVGCGRLTEGMADVVVGRKADFGQNVDDAELRYASVRRRMRTKR